MDSMSKSICSFERGSGNSRGKVGINESREKAQRNQTKTSATSASLTFRVDQTACCLSTACSCLLATRKVISSVPPKITQAYIHDDSSLDSYLDRTETQDPFGTIIAVPISCLCPSFEHCPFTERNDLRPLIRRTHSHSPELISPGNDERRNIRRILPVTHAPKRPRSSLPPRAPSCPECRRLAPCSRRRRIGWRRRSFRLARRRRSIAMWNDLVSLAIRGGGSGCYGMAMT